MIELLLSLGLLGAIAVVTTSWLGTAAEATTAAPAIRWRAAAEAVMALVHDDLAVGDLESDPRRPNVEVDAGNLRVRTRATGSHLAGPVVHEYLHDTARGELVLRERAASGQERRRLLLNQVRGWDCEFDKDRGVLDVAIERADGFVIKRRFSHAPGD